ncbi:MAG: hypothetical protein R3E21_08045 [Caenibius sp.]
MTILEASLRNLVNEEATSAALKAVSAIPKDTETLAANRDAILEIIADAAAKQFGQLRLAAKHVAQEHMLRQNRAENPAPIHDDQLASYREAAIKLAISTGASGDDLVMIAAQFARFIIDGVMDGKARNADQ